MGLYDPKEIENFYDAYGAKEWDRFSIDLEGFINFEIHRHFLKRHIRPGDHVLDIGAGPGHFTIELAKLGAKIGVADLSNEQLRLNQEKVEASGFEHSVLFRTQADVLDLANLPQQKFDAVVCFGGPISYVFDQAGEALDEIRRVLKPGGLLLTSVMSLMGAMRRFLPGVIEVGERFGQSLNSEVLQTGDLLPKYNNGHGMRMYRWSRLRELLTSKHFEIVASASSNFLSVQNGDALKTKLEASPDLKNQILAWELSACEDPGVIDAGTHIITAAGRAESR